ncbi:MAG: cyclic nucleotide-gated ion channel [Alphaproteobacteria bacterium]
MNASSPSGRHAWPLVAVDCILAVAIAASAFGAMASSVPDRDALLEAAALAAVRGSLAVFSAEFALRLWSAAQKRRGVAYVLSFAGAIDLAAVLPGWAALVSDSLVAAAEIAGVLSLLKLWRFLPALAILGAVLRREGRALAAALAARLVLLARVSTFMFHLEREAQPEIFRSIPHALWWGIVTMATVGYGDMAPVTLAGRVFGGITMTLGIAMFAVPAGIIATGFADELRKREVMVTWRSVARVPLFSRLDANRVSEIAGMLKPGIVPAHSIIVRRGDSADAMFFVMEGEVEVDLQPEPVRLGPGEFFGEMALVTGMRRNATVSSVTECRLLRLHVADFRRLAEANPEILEEIRKVAAGRAGRDGEQAGPGQ